MSETFASYFEKSLENLNLTPGTLVQAQIIDILPDWVILNAGLKSEAVVSKKEFINEKIEVGGHVSVVIVAVENGFGETRLSRDKARRAQSWVKMQELFESGETVTGIMADRVKGGFTVHVESLQAFLPGSLVDIKPVRDTSYLDGKELEFKIIKMDQKRNNIVVSRRAVLQEEGGAERQARLDQLQEGQEIMGIVKNITDYGAFVDLGGIDGLLHVTDMSWKRIKHPSVMLNVGDELKVKVLKFDREKSRVSLGIKQLGDDPWVNIERRYTSNSRVFGSVTNVTDYGCFVQLEEGVEGLVHMSEMDWTNKNVHPSRIVKSGQELEVMVLDVDESRRRISLGLKQCKGNPWQEFTDNHEVNDTVSGKVRSITDFGVFIGLDGNIDGLVHLSDLSWAQSGEEAVKSFKKGDEVTAAILSMDPERERISLGLKQLETDKVSTYMQSLGDKETVVKATVQAIAPKHATLQLAEGIEAFMKIDEFSVEHTKDLTEELSEGQELDVKVVDVDYKNRRIYVSHRATSDAAIKAARRVQRTEAPTTATLGDLLKKQMNKDD